MSALTQLVDLLKRFEGCRLHAYHDEVGVLTIGWGETLGVTPGMTWTQEQADDALAIRAKQFMSGVLIRCPDLIDSNNRLVACTSLAYNIGLGGFGVSSVRRLTSRGEYSRAADSFLLWDKAGGARDHVLTLRRRAERLVYLGQ